MQHENSLEAIETRMLGHVKKLANGHDTEDIIERKKRTYDYQEELENTKYKPKSKANRLAKLEANKLPSVFSEEYLSKQPSKISSILREIHEEQKQNQPEKVHKKCRPSFTMS